MLVTVEGMVVKTQKALSALKDRIQQIGLGPSNAQLKLFEVRPNPLITTIIAYLELDTNFGFQFVFTID